MRSTAHRTWITCIVAAVLFAGGLGFTATAEAAGNGRGKIVVADRASGTISVISARTDELLGSVALPAGENPPEPMYVFSSPFQRRVFVGDRANHRVVAFDARNFDVVGTAEAGAGVFHMWGSVATGELWVNCDIDNTIAVIDMRTLETRGIIPAPEDLAAMGGKVHDVVVTPNGFFAYVTMLGVADGQGCVVQYDARTYEEVGRAMVGDDPHVSLTLRNPYLYVPAQASGMVHVFDRYSMEPMADIEVPGAHGAGMARSGRFFYTTNLPGGGTDALWTIDTTTSTLVGGPVDTPYGVPHNIALTPNGKKLYVTHSGGTSDKVTIYRVRGRNPVPEYEGEVTVGLNPFGLAYVH